MGATEGTVPCLWAPILAHENIRFRRIQSWFGSMSFKEILGWLQGRLSLYCGCRNHVRFQSSVTILGNLPASLFDFDSGVDSD